MPAVPTTEMKAVLKIYLENGTQRVAHQLEEVGKVLKRRVDGKEPGREHPKLVKRLERLGYRIHQRQRHDRAYQREDDIDRYIAAD